MNIKLFTIKHIFLITAILLLLCSPALGATYGPIAWDGDGETKIDGDDYCGGSMCQPGDIIEFASGTDVLCIEDMRGTSANPIVFRNTSAGQAIIDLSGAYLHGIEVVDCEHVTLDGTNAAGVTYGIRVTDGHVGVWSGGYLDRCEGLIIHNVQIDTMQGQGIMVKGYNNDSNGTITVGLTIRDCYLFDIDSEGMYLGNAAYQHHQDVEVYDCILTNIGWDGIQLREAVYGTNSIHDNTITNFGKAQNLGHASAIVLDGPFVGDVYNNDITITTPQAGGYGHGIAFLVYSPNVITASAYNNIVDMGGQGSNNFLIGDANVTVTAYQNTLLNAVGDGFFVRNNATAVLRDNIICSPGDDYVECAGANCTETNNLENACASNNFTDLTNDDFSLTTSSPAKDTGSASGYPSTDIIGTVRPQGSLVDRGAYEFIPSGDPPPSSDWGRKCELVIQNSKVPGDLSAFPVLITEVTLDPEMIDSDDADYAANKAQADGGDLRFYTDSAGSNRLACEIVDFTHGANPTVEIWVLVPTAYSAVDTSIWVYYNATGKSQPAANAVYGSEAVWANYQAVWHFDEVDGGGGTVYYDETSNSNDGTLTDADDDSTRGTGQIGASIDFNGDVDFIDCNKDSSIEIGTSDWTISCWTKMAAGSNYFIDKGGNSAAQEGYSFWYYGTNDDLRGNLSDGITKISGDSNNTLALDDSAWRFVAVTYDRSSNVTFYSDSGGSFGADGSESIAALDSIDITNAGEDFRIGRNINSYSVTSIDELRVYRGLLSSNWLTAEYNNQDAPNTFIVEGAPANVTTTDTTRAAITKVGRWIEATKTCDTTTAITYSVVGDIIPLCFVCDEVLSVEVPGIETAPSVTLLPGPLTASESTAVYAGYDNSGATTIIKANYTIKATERSVDLKIKDVSSFLLGQGSSIALTGISSAALGEATTASTHGLSTDDYVYFNQLGEMTEIEDNCYKIIVTDTNKFTFGVDTSGYAEETDGGSEECFKMDTYMVDPYKNMLDPDLTAAGLDFGVITVIVIYPSDSPLELTAVDAWVDLIAAGYYSLPGDNVDCNFMGDLDTDNSGTKLNPINITGEIDGDVIFDEDYWIIIDLDVSGSLKITGDHIVVE